MIEAAGLIVNLNARRVARRLARERGWAGTLPDNRVWRTRTLAELEQAVQECRSIGAIAIASLGGDGTHHHLLNTIQRVFADSAPPPLLLLAGGTLNGITRSLGTGGPPVRVMERPLVPVTRTILQVTDLARGQTLYGFGFAAGVPYRIGQRYYSFARPGLAAAIRAMVLLPIRNALTHGPLFDDIRLDVRTAAGPWPLTSMHTLAASTLDDPLLWFRPFGLPLAAGRFHLAGTTMRPAEMTARLWSIYRGRCRHPRLRIEQVDAATVRGNAGFLIDGELYDVPAGLHLEITAHSRLRFLVPPDGVRAQSPKPGTRP